MLNTFDAPYRRNLVLKKIDREIFEKNSKDIFFEIRTILVLDPADPFWIAQMARKRHRQSKYVHWCQEIIFCDL